MMNLLVLGLLGMNLCLAKSLADTKETTMTSVFTEPIKKTYNKVTTKAKDIYNKAVNYTKDMAHKAADCAKDTYNKAVDSALTTVVVCQTTVHTVASNVKTNVVTRYRAVEENVVKHTVIYKETQATNDELLAKIEELQAKVDAITEAKKVVNRPKSAKKPAKANA